MSPTQDWMSRKMQKTFVLMTAAGWKVLSVSRAQKDCALQKSVPPGAELQVSNPKAPLVAEEAPLHRSPGLLWRQAVLVGGGVGGDLFMEALAY